MEFLKSKTFMIILAVVICIGAAIGVTYGVLTHTEPGLLGACWGSTGEAVETYELNGAEACPELRWDPEQFPLTVTVVTDNPHPPADVARTLDRQINLINERLGFTALRIDTSDGLCLDHHSICVQAEVAHEPGFADDHGDATHWRAPDGGMHCTARTSNTGTAELFGLVMQHELGHCLGLAHDPRNDQSIMRPTQSPTPDRQLPPWISDFDRSLLRGIYMR